MSRIAVVPGSFDPVTIGHLEVIAKAARLFDEVRVVVVHNPGKAALFPADRRAALIRSALADAGIRGPEVDLLESGLLVDYCREVGAVVIVKGLRSAVDLAYETPMAIVNRDLAGVDTVFVPAEPGSSHVSSSLVRQVVELGGDVSRYVPDAVATAIAEGALR